MGIKVTLRQKPITKGRQTLYLDFYPPIPDTATGKSTRREFLGQYLYKKPKTPIEKEHNRSKLIIAESLRQQRDNELNKPEIYSGYEKEQLKIKEQGEHSFIEYFKQLSSKRKESNKANWSAALAYLDQFTHHSLSFSQLTERFCNEFKESLQDITSIKSEKSKLSQNSAVSYFNKFKAALKQAYKDGLLSIDLNSRIEGIKQEETRRNFLTIEELNSLIKTECQNPIMKNAALFSALTGLRFSDIQKLTWGEIEFMEGQGYFIHFKQQKTKGIETLPISEQAYNILGERRVAHDQVFEGLSYSAYHNKHLYLWIGAAGITKEITFHSFRHTYATLLLSEGADLFTVSKMLGHRDLKTTQIYAKVMDHAKRTAANKIKLNF